MYHNPCIHSSVDGHLDCFPVLAIVNSAAVNIVGTCVFFNDETVPQGVYPVVGLLGHMVVYS